MSPSVPALSGSFSRRASCRRAPGFGAGPHRAPARGVRAACSAAKFDIRVCTHTTCRRQGSQQVLKFAKDLGLEELEVSACGCLGNCGNGPNMVVLPLELVLRHVATPADFADVLKWQCQIAIGPEILKATELRLAGNALAMEGRLEEAVARYQAALELKPLRCVHMLHSNLSAAHLQMGDREAALQHATLAVAAAPEGFHTGHVRLVDALYALGSYTEAATALADAVQSRPGFTDLPEYKLMRNALKDAKQRQQSKTRT